MAITKGLAALKEVQAEAARRQAENERPKADWLKLTAEGTDGSVVVGRFLQELDEENEFYNSERGVALLAVEHQAPGDEGFKRRATCTIDSGACYACEQLKSSGEKEWKQRQNFYINFLSDDGKVYVISRGASSGFVKSLLAELEDEGNITQANYRITRTGAKSTTQWNIKRLKSDPIDDSKAEVFDLEQVALRNVEYERQSEYYGAVWKGASETKAEAKVDDEW